MSENSQKSYPLDVDGEIQELSKLPIEHGVISEPCVVLTDDDRLVVATFDIHQEIQDGKLIHYWGWYELVGARLNDEKDGIDMHNGIGIDVVKWQKINFLTGA